MPTYDYICDGCGHRFERQQPMKEAPLTQCPECGGAVRRLITGGGGFIIRGADSRRTESACSLEATGRTCCGRSDPCGAPSCGGD